MAYKNKEDYKRWCENHKEYLKEYNHNRYINNIEYYINKNKERDKLYKVWYNMKNRCNDERNVRYNWYGGRGIKVCSEWETYEVFKKDMQKGYKEGVSIDRIDNDKGYFKENCRWATNIEQANNKRNNKKITYQGSTLTLNQWGRKIGVKESAMRVRYYCYKWPTAKLLKEATSLLYA